MSRFIELLTEYKNNPIAGYFIMPSDALIYFERAGDEVIIRNKTKLHPAEVIQFAQNKTGFNNWIIKYGYPIEANGVWEWRLV